MATGIVLFSAGLDSSLAAKLLVVQSVNIRLVTFLHPFIGDLESFRGSVTGQAELVGCEVEFVEMGLGYLDVVARPAQGYGRNMNPCIDCRIYQLQLAKKLLAREGGEFIATGEVLGQRPMSQRRGAMELIDRQAGVKGLVVRPLSARLMEPSDAEARGTVDRNRLMNIRGRSRRRQMDLAKDIGIRWYPAPAGGCLLTDRQFSARLKDLMEHEGLTLGGIEMLKVGRHFRASEGCRIVVGRNEGENGRLKRLREVDVLVEPEDFKGPDCIIRGEASGEVVGLACSLVVRYSRCESGRCRVSWGEGRCEWVSSGKARDEVCKRLRIGADEE